MAPIGTGADGHNPRVFIVTPSEFSQWLALAPGAPRRVLVMGVLNVTPDSFSDAGRFAAPDAAVAHGDAQIDAGADLIDIGGESTRPGSLPVAPDEQIRRVIPVVERLARRPVILSIDTTRASVAAAALNAGAKVVNDISAGRDDPDMLPLIARARVPIILMHMQGTPLTMQENPSYGDVVKEVAGFLGQRLNAAKEAGIDPSRILLDPGIGFGKTQAHNLELLRRLDELTHLGRPLVIGTSRKGFIGRITDEPEASKRLFGTAASVAWSAAHGAGIVRVHDVKAMKQVVRMVSAIIHGT